MGEPATAATPPAAPAREEAEGAAPVLRVLPEPDVEESSTSAQDVGRFVAWVAVTFRPPQVWSQRPPAAREVVASARNRDQHPARRAYAGVAALLTAVGVGAIWIVQSPARLLVALVLVGVVLAPLVVLV